MDEVDRIVLSSLNEIGFVPRENITNLKLYSFEELVAMAMMCFQVIHPDAGFPPSIPPMMSARYNLCAQFAQICKDLGYKRDVGYHTFMYNNITDIRNVLLFLVEHIPKQNAFEETNDQTQNLSIRQKIGEELKNLFTVGLELQPNCMCKIPFASLPLETGTLLPNQNIDCKPLEWRNFVVHDLPFIDEQLPDSRCLLPSVISLNSRGLINPTKPKCSKFNSTTIDSKIFESLSIYSGLESEYVSHKNCMMLRARGKESAEVQLLQIGECVREHNSQYQDTSALPFTMDDESVIALEKEMNAVKFEIITLKENIENVTQTNKVINKNLQAQLSHELSLQQSIALLPDSENNIPKLEQAIEKCKIKISNLEVYWKSHQELLLNKKSELQSIVDQKIAEKDGLIETITEIRKKLFNVVQDIQKRTIIEQRLREATIGDGVQRSEFIKRILDMIKNINKQESQIKNILNDMKYVQKEINILSGKVGRSFEAAEQLVNSRSTDFSIETLKLIATLHKDVSEILNMIDEMGRYAREIKDLEDQCRDNNNNIEETLKQVRLDLRRLKKEQSTIVNEIALYNKVVATSSGSFIDNDADKSFINTDLYYDNRASYPSTSVIDDPTSPSHSHSGEERTDCESS